MTLQTKQGRLSINYLRVMQCHFLPGHLIHESLEISLNGELQTERYRVAQHLVAWVLRYKAGNLPSPDP